MKKILVANRGEIAVRVLRSAMDMGIRTVAIYSDADRAAPHVVLADQAVHIGASPASSSYLDIEKIIRAAKETGVDGIHPGYGFLSENAEFARRCEQEGITFIGPSAESIEIMGSKLAAKAAVGAYDIPMVPGIDRAISDVKEAQVIAKKIGFPILIKASAGGGGKGMRLVETADQLEEQMERAISEAQSSFGDGSVFIEKFVMAPRHIEIQVLADQYGNTIHLFERECSIQRRHQKVIEEAPSSILSPEMRDAMGKAAIGVARSCNYTGAGTVEFLVDGDLNFYFLEMNTRLQVEHPVTEMITGVDLVEQQIRIARGEVLSIAQDDLIINGHSLELRVYAEDPHNEFLPSIGTLTTYTPPSGNGIRVDDGYREGMEIPIFYDPMIAKLVVHGSSRNAAIDLMNEAIDQYAIDGIQTTLSFGKFAFNHEAFISGKFDTHFIPRYFQRSGEEVNDEERVAALMALRAWMDHNQLLTVPNVRESNWLKREE